MQRCPKCRCAGRRKAVKATEDGPVEELICANPRCQNYRRVFAEAPLEVADETVDNTPKA